MGKWIEQREVKRVKNEKEKVRNEKLAGYFLNLSQLTFVALVLGGVTPLYLNVDYAVSWLLICAGVLMTFFLASIGYNILKK